MMSNDFEFKDLTIGQLNSLVEMVGGCDRVLQILSGDLEIRFLSTMGNQTTAISVETDQLLTIEAGLMFEERITRGQYSWRNSDLREEWFPVTADQVGKWEWRLFHFNFNCKIPSRKASFLIKENAFELGQIGHILAFGEKYPEEQRKFPIIGLGSVAGFDVDHYVPALGIFGAERTLNLGWFEGGWSNGHRFLGVRRHVVA